MSTRSDPSGVVIVDKPEGMTSHDVVARARRLLGTRRVGHAGTLDPMATGVLVLLVGEATKLDAYLTAHHKRYDARVAFGLATDTLDRDGKPLERAHVPAWLREDIAHAAAGEGASTRLAAAIEAERARTAQVPPAYSAIQVDGQRSYDRARAGEAVELAPRSVHVGSIDIVGGAPEAPELPHVDLEIEVSKGYYVRSLARDLGERLGVPAHLAALRRVASGPFTLASARALDAELLRAGITPLEEAARAALAVGRLTDEGALRARRGQRLSARDFEALPPAGEPSAWIDPRGSLVAVGTLTQGEEGASLVLHRGFVE